MIGEISFGQYYQADTPVHKLDPRVKLLATLLFVISLFLPASLAGMIFAGLCLLALIRLSQVPLRLIVKGLRPVLFIIVFSFLANLFGPGDRILWRLGFLTLTYEGLVRAVYLALRLVYLVLGSSLMTFTTTPWRLTDGLEKGLHFLTYVRVPVHELAMMMAIALKFIPILAEELARIKDAQISRGADFESGNIIDRGRRLMPLLVPLFVSAIRRASDLAMALEVRGYAPGKKRTRLHPLKYSRQDYLAYGLILLYMIIMIIIAFSPIGRWSAGL